MVFLLDNDVILKIACLNLVELYLDLYDERKGIKYCLSTLPRQIKYNKKWNARYGEETLQRARAMVEKLHVLNQLPDADTHALLNTIPEVDAGEAVLFASARTFPEFTIQTGDKRCLIALAENKALPDEFIQLFAGKVQSFEQILLALIQKFGFKRIRASVAERKGCDGALDNIFASGGQTTSDNAIEGLESYIRDLRKCSGRYIHSPEE